MNAINDRDLLKKAAIAAGITVMWSEPFKRYEQFRLERYVGSWNPLKNDDDAFRLAVELKLRVDQMYMGGPKVMVGFGESWAIESYSGDPLNATRRAIVRAAVEIGERKQ